ncbi:MAG: 3-dehydroquinate synthase II [bacterium]|nr:3-dehydroquinate synthase II [bacterium]
MKAKYNDVVINSIVQDDWHVRVHGANGEPRNVTTLKPDDKVLAHITNPGSRHVGIKVEEIIIEV